MPKYLMLIVEDESTYSEDSFAPDSPQFNEVMEMHRDFSQSVVKSGATILGGEALQPTPTATYLRNTRTSNVVSVDNPAPDVKEALGGFYLVEARDDAHARELAELCPAPGGYIELRPVWEIGSE